jgi:hypothetical protein
MKLSNLFKKQKATAVVVEKLEKNQLEKVIGGLSEIPTVAKKEEGGRHTPFHNK